MKDIEAHGAYYIGLEQGESPQQRPCILNGNVINVGDRISHLGCLTKKNRHFEMKKGWTLEFAGWWNKYLLFLPYGICSGEQLTMFDSGQKLNLFYAFGYVDATTLFVPSGRGSGWEIRY